jgi:hypothetical protein
LKGVTLFFDEEIQVRVIPIENEQIIKAPASDITYRNVKPGENFDLTLFESMFLIMQEEYSGFCEVFGDPNGVCFSPTLIAFFEGRSRFASPIISYPSSPENIARKSLISLNGIEVLKW